MLGRVLAIALNTYRESVRARLLLGLAGVAFAVALYALVVGAFTLRSAPRVASDLGSASISLFSIAVAIVIGATSLYRELEQKTIFPILARPIGRGEYLVGKYLGTLLTIAVFILADAGLVLLLSAALARRSPELVARSVLEAIGLGTLAVAALAVASRRWSAARTYGPIPFALTLAVLGAILSGNAPEERSVVLGSSALAFIEASIIAAFVTLFSSFSTPFLTALLTVGVFLVGRRADALARLPVKQYGQAIHDAGVGLSNVVPNLEVYVPPRPLLTGELPEPKLLPYIGMAAIVGLGWSIGLLTVAALLFRKRDFL
jgi:Cu-processing system permease protein